MEKYGIEVVKIPWKLKLADRLTHGISKKDQALFHDAIGISVRSLESTSAMVEEAIRLAVAGSSACSCIWSGIGAGSQSWHNEEGSSSKAGNEVWGQAWDMWGQGGATLGLGLGARQGCGGG